MAGDINAHAVLHTGSNNFGRDGHTTQSSAAPDDVLRKGGSTQARCYPRLRGNGKVTSVGAMQQSTSGLGDGNGMVHGGAPCCSRSKPTAWFAHVLLLRARASFRQLTAGVDNSMHCGEILIHNGD